jgi:hypothetical protein
MLAAVAVIGNAYWRLHRSDIQPTASPRRAAAQDLFFGQVATLWARWFVIVGGALLVLSRAATAEQLALGIAPIVVLLVVNFALHGRYLVERPANQALTLLASGLDLVVAATLFLAWPGTGGIANPVFVFFYPLVFAFALVFPPRLTAAFTTVVLVAYGLLLLPGGFSSMGDIKQVVVRLMTLAAVGALGTVYWRMVRREERHAEEPNRSVTWRPAEAG